MFKIRENQNTPIKVAHIITAYLSVVTILDAKLQALDKFDEISLSVISSPPKMTDLRTPIRHFSIPMARSIRVVDDIKSIWRLYRLLKEEKFHIVHSHTAKAGFITAIAAWMAKVPFVCHTYHGLPFYKGQAHVRYLVYRILESLACRFRDVVFSQNKNDMAICAQLMRSSRKALYEGNGIDISQVRVAAKSELKEAEKCFFPGFRIVMLSRLEPVKRIHDFLDAIRKIIDFGINVSVVLAGTGPLEAELKKEIKRCGLDDCVNMIGFTNQPHGILSASDLVVLCSEKEGMPRALIEGMAVGKAVVATDVPGTREVVLNKATGYLVPLGDINALAEKIIDIIHNPELRKAMGEAGMKRVTVHFDDIKIAELLHEFYLNRAQV